MKNLILIAFFILAGCAVPVQYVATGGSKADGTVELSYDAGAFMSPVTDEQQGANLAAQRCNSWGYGHAEAFGGTVRECYDNACNSFRISKQYQCVD